MLTHPSVDRRVRVRMGIFLAIGIVILGIIVRDTLAGELSVPLALLAVVLGIALGYPLGRAARLKWHETEERIISEMDIVGVIAILAYIGVRLGSRWLVGQWLSGTALSTFTLALLGGALLGRYLGTRRTLKRVLDRAR
jgi:hypothetical protein